MYSCIMCSPVLSTEQLISKEMVHKWKEFRKTQGTWEI